MWKQQVGADRLLSADVDLAVRPEQTAEHSQIDSSLLSGRIQIQKAASVHVEKDTFKKKSTFGAHDAAQLDAHNMKACSLSFLYLLMHEWSYTHFVVCHAEESKHIQHL